MSTLKIILVTGGSGFLGSHIISQLLSHPQRYTVRAPTRNPAKLASIFPEAIGGKKLEVFNVASINANHKDVMKDVESVIHCTSTVFGEGVENEEIMKGTYYGTVNIANHALKAGVKKIIMTSTLGTVFDHNDLKGQPGFLVYLIAKTAAEKKFWEIARENPQVDFTSIVPGAIYGPYLAEYSRVLSSSPSSLGSNAFFYALLGAQYPPMPVAHVVDVRDVAKAHILALSLSSSMESAGEKKRNRFFVANGVHTWTEAASLIASLRPELRVRLPGKDKKAALVPQTCAPLDMKATEDVLGMKDTDYLKWEGTVSGVVDGLVGWESAMKN